ncbi:hypothetical protein PR048_011216 [Dryococelus australis]|uniref:Uncharacterized protein n=1 Tax=Dryococelus australis TaxID=614101 RepID=A0ABQ9HL54_9NEOP|nr:hypothetical protein PR048_011216 [Dryococelus australis]
MARNTGNAYVTADGKVKDARVLKPWLDCCMQCRSKFSGKENFKNFMSIGKWLMEINITYVSNRVETCEKLSCRPCIVEENKLKFRFTTNTYYLEINGERRKVCKGCFQTALCATKCFIELAMQNELSSSDSGIPVSDNREREPRKYKWSESVRDDVKHIQSFLANDITPGKRQPKNICNLRQLWVSLTAHDCATKEVKCFMWHEGIANHGANDIASCLLKLSDNLPKDVKHAVFYSDTYPGQNRNFYVAVMFSWALQRNTNLQYIDHKFVVPGHTHLECDYFHSAIERENRRLRLRLLNLYVLLLGLFWSLNIRTGLERKGRRRLSVAEGAACSCRAEVLEIKFET